MYVKQIARIFFDLQNVFLSSVSEISPFIIVYISSRGKYTIAYVISYGIVENVLFFAENVISRIVSEDKCILFRDEKRDLVPRKRSYAEL